MSHAAAISIRSAVESETFDLGGQHVSTITNTIRQAFDEPLNLDEMIRITFVTGAGKLGRQKYDEGAAKAVTSTLRELGFEEDRGASCVVECGGSFKMQHDTGKNLKTVVVFPRITGASAVEEGVGAISISKTKSLLPEGSPEQLVAASSQAVFERMLQSKCPSWSQKKGCIAAIESIKHLLEGLDSKLLSGTPLNDSEQDLYDTVSASALEEKEAFVKKQMHAQVESANITKRERDTLLDQVSEKLDTIKKELTASAGKPKKQEKLTTMQTRLQERQDMLDKISPKVPHQLRHEAEIAKLMKELYPLQQIEEGAKGRLLTVKETQALGRKEEIVQQIEQLEESSRGWFEEDETFAARVEASRISLATKTKPKATRKAGSSASGGFKSIGATKWVTPGAQKKSAWGSSSKPAKQKASPGNVFAAMMMDSDSD